MRNFFTNFTNFTNFTWNSIFFRLIWYKSLSLMIVLTFVIQFLWKKRKKNIHMRRAIFSNYIWNVHFFGHFHKFHMKFIFFSLDMSEINATDDFFHDFSIFSIEKKNYFFSHIYQHHQKFKICKKFKFFFLCLNHLLWLKTTIFGNSYLNFSYHMRNIH